MVPGMAAVLRAAKDNNVAKMTELLAIGVDPNVGNQIGQTGLHVAALWGCVEVSEVLLRGNANINAVKANIFSNINANINAIIKANTFFNINAINHLA